MLCMLQCAVGVATEDTPLLMVHIGFYTRIIFLLLLFTVDAAIFVCSRKRLIEALEGLGSGSKQSGWLKTRSVRKVCPADAKPLAKTR